MTAHLRSLAKAALVSTVFVAAATAATAADWRDKYKVIKIGSVTVENQAATVTRFKPFADYIEKKLGVKVEVFTASDYAGIVQALSAGQIHLGRMGGAAYAAGYIDSEGEIEPLVMNVEPNGGKGYHSVLIVRSDSPYKSIDDLKGKSLAWADPNSTSGFLVPNAALRDAGIDPQKHFSRTVFSGGHEQSVLGVLKGNFDSAFTWTSPGHQSGQFRIMMDRGMLKLDDIRIVWESPLIANPLWAVSKKIPADMRKDLLDMFVNLAKDDMAMAEAAAQGKTSGFEPVTHETYKTFVTIAEDQRKARRKQ
ncbi:phosphonate ABC transporter substrate-binding protein [Pseudorhodoplanes sp.]|uniref:phosphonate ABC transporter substrate-binding protein n=1 Tax=Pseudorhodoplanes sp. TaxID=1934341 RepID=UPI00391D0307